VYSLKDIKKETSVQTIKIMAGHRGGVKNVPKLIYLSLTSFVVLLDFL